MTLPDRVKRESVTGTRKARKECARVVHSRGKPPGIPAATPTLTPQGCPPSHKGRGFREGAEGRVEGGGSHTGCRRDSHMYIEITLIT